ncbi:MAG: hypothetical protein AAGK05_17185 [Pseudomonadota bacterium]
MKEKERQEIQREEKQKQRDHELEMARLMQSTHGATANANNSLYDAKVNCPKLPTFVDRKDELDSYLNRFERFAKSNGWDKSTWSSSLSALLTGRALDVYSRLSDSDASHYESLKEALLKRYELTESGFRHRFRNSKPEIGESPEQFITRLRNYLQRWIELSGTDQNSYGVCDLFTQEPFISICSPDLAIFLKERSPSDLDEVAKLADQYLLAHDQRLASNDDENKVQSNHFKSDKNNKPRQQSSKNFHRNSTANFHSGNNNFKIKCIFCALWHKSENCRKAPSMDIKQRRELARTLNACFLCLMRGHITKHDV